MAPIVTPTTYAVRFWSYVDPPKSWQECWEWKGTLQPAGYGKYWYGRHGLAHRFSYELHVGPIPEGLHIDHLCRNRRCVNPTHLEPVTTRENVLRGEGLTARHARQTHCLRGHEFTPENTYLYGDGAHRSCRACRTLRARAHRPQQAAA